MLHASAQSSNGEVSQPDSTKWRVEASSGYYTQEGVSAGGFGLFVDVGRQLDTGFIASLGFGMAQTYRRFPTNTALFGGERFYQTHYVFRLSFDYPFRLSDRQRLFLGTGLLYVRRYSTFPGVQVLQPEPDVLVLDGATNPLTPDVVGLHFSAKYGYRLSRVTLGLRLDAHLFQFERGGEYIAAPFLQVHF